jgi:hypothetical protein
VLVSLELYYGFKDFWTPLLPNFYVVPFFKGWLGFLFPNEAEAKKITNKINAIAPKKEDYEKRINEMKRVEEE